MRRRNRRYNVVDDSDEESCVGSDAQDSDNSVNNSNAANNGTQTPKRKRGRPPGAKNKRQKLQNDSDIDASPQPSISQGSDSENTSDPSDSSDSDYVVNNSARKKKASPRRPGRPPVANNKRQRLQKASDGAGSPQPSTSQPTTSQNTAIQNNADEESESSGSESVDSDYGPVHDVSQQKKKAAPSDKRHPPPRAPRSAKKKINYSVNGVAPPKVAANGNLNSSQTKSFQRMRSSASNEVSFDPKSVESLAQKLVYFLLIEDQKKYAIRRKAIVTHVFKDEAYSPKLYSAVIKKANIILKKTFGMELMELENQKDSYLIVNILRRELGIHDYVELPRIKQQQHGLILYILTVIYMNENVITEDELTKCLRPLGIDLTAKRNHPVFGDVKKYITTELVKQMYLNYECISKEPPKYEFTWGIRAKQEFDKRDLLKFVCEIIDDTSPQDWRIQFKDAEESAKPNADS